jgi:hypothetical protein
MNSILNLLQLMHLNGSRPHDLKWTVEIGCYRGLPAVASATTEDPDPHS